MLSVASFILAPVSAAVAGFFWYHRQRPAVRTTISHFIFPRRLQQPSLLRPTTDTTTVKKSISTLYYYVPLTTTLGCLLHHHWGTVNYVLMTTGVSSLWTRLFPSSSSSVVFTSVIASSSTVWQTIGHIGICVLMYTLAARFRCIGITGGIATGKSTVSKLLQKKGLRILDLDILAREIVVPGEPAYHKIVKHFGPNVLLPIDSSSSSASSLPGLNRQWLRHTIANSSEQRKILNGITHPAIFQRLFRQVAYYRWWKGETVVIDAPLLYESGWILRLLCGPIIVTASPRDLQLQRLMTRDGMDNMNAEKMIDTQMSLEQKIRLADYVIYTISTLEVLEDNVDKLLQQLHIVSRQQENDRAGNSNNSGNNPLTTKRTKKEE